MNAMKAVRAAEHRKKLAAIPGKMLLSVLILIGIKWDTDIHTVIAHMQADPLTNIRLVIYIYGGVSYVYTFISLFHNWLIGIITAGVVGFLVFSYTQDMADDVRLIAFYVMIFGGPVLDVLRLFHYLILKLRIDGSTAEFWHDAYDEGYDTGFDRGYDKAIHESERHRRSDETFRRKTGIGRDEYEEEYKRINSRSRYDDDYYDDEDYDEDYDEEDYDEDDSYDQRDRRSSQSSSRTQAPDVRRAGAGSSFFADCADDAAIKRRYRDLCKVYHPDSGNGSSAVFNAINDEYHALMGK